MLRYLTAAILATALSACGDSSTPQPDMLVVDVRSDTTTPNAGPVELQSLPSAAAYATVGSPVSLIGSASTGAVSYQWSFGDGQAWDTPRALPDTQHVYQAPGRYQAVLTVFDQTGAKDVAAILISVTHEITFAPQQSSSIIRFSGSDGAERVAVVSPDADELTLIRRHQNTFAIERHQGVCDGPRNVALLGNQLAVACQNDARLALVPVDGSTPPAMLQLPPSSRPFGVVTAHGKLFVTLQATGQVAEVNVNGGAPALAQLHTALADARGIALIPDGRLAVTRWRSSDSSAEVLLLDHQSGATTPIEIAIDPQASSDTEIGGIPSYLSQVLVSPTGRDFALPSLQANILEGGFRAAKPLAFDTTVRAIVSFVNLSNHTEDFGRRLQFDGRGLASAAVYSSRGDFLFVAFRGAQIVGRVDALSNSDSGTIFNVGLAPQGLALSEDDRYLYVDSYLSRTVTIYDVSDFTQLPQPVAQLASLSNEPLSATVLLGKQLFNNSSDTRVARDNYLACAHCHLDGEADGRVWDFTDRGEGLRNTISLLGRSGIGHGPLHWSANFDEVQDFEHDIRNAAQGSGLMADADFFSGNRDQPLGGSKAGVSADLDALAAYVTSLQTPLPSPFRKPDGMLTEAAIRGEAIFNDVQVGCASCHAGQSFTDSGFVAPGQPLLHDVGTLGAGSGQRLGGPLAGIDTPTLLGLWNNAPYLHDGSAATLLDVLTVRNANDQHGVTSQLTAMQLSDLVAYLRSL